eukprot:jgi/Ulvmu1/4389/UM002_0114.1
MNAALCNSGFLHDDMSSQATTERFQMYSFASPMQAHVSAVTLSYPCAAKSAMHNCVHVVLAAAQVLGLSKQSKNTTAANLAVCSRHADMQTGITSDQCSGGV